MTGKRLQRARAIFEKLVDLPAEQRSPILAEDCSGDGQLEAFVEELLANHDGGMGEFLANPAYVSDSDPASADATRLPQHIGRYEIIRLIGEGGMGAVYEAQQENPQRRVALKVIRPGLAASHTLRRFQQEADLLGQLQHPGIAQIHEAGVAEVTTAAGASARQPFFAMELIRGGTLHEYARSARLGTRERLELVARVCDAVQHAHQKGVIHRDLKPGNILVDQTGQPKILDFGVARATDADMQTITMQTGVGQLIGTVPYMSPEQVAGDSRQLDTRSDVYALGVILYELLSGSVPHDVRHLSVPQAVRKVREEEPQRLGSIDRTLRGEVEIIVTRALEKDRTRRYQSASELAADIRRYLRGEAIEAKSDSGWYVLRKTLARYRAAVGIAAAFVVLITAATIALGIMYRGQMLAREAEEQQRHLAETNEARAKDETAKAKAVTGLLQEMLSSASPYEEKGPDYTVRQLLDDFVVGLHDQLTDQPEVEATVRQTVGKTYQALGLYADAEPQLRTALDIQRRLLEDQHPDVIASHNSLAELLLQTGANAEADQHLRAALGAARRCWGDQHEQIATILNNLGLVLQAQGAYEEAEALLRETLAMRRQLFGDEHEHVAVSLNNLAVLLRIKGDYAGAEPLYREALAMRRRLLGDEHPELANSLSNLALLLHYRGQYDEAESLYREALDMLRKMFPAGHPDIASNLNSLAGLSQLRGDRDGAETLFRQALSMRRELLPAEHPAVARSLSNLGTVLRDKGKYDEAEALYREALAIVRAALPEEHPVIATRLERLALVLVDQRQYAEAEALLRESLAIRQKALPSGDRTFAATESKLGACLTLAGRYDEAEALLLRSHEILKDCPEDATPAQRMALEENVRRVVQLYEASDRPDQAAKWRAKLPTPQPAELSPHP